VVAATFPEPLTPCHPAGRRRVLRHRRPGVRSGCLSAWYDAECLGEPQSATSSGRFVGTSSGAALRFAVTLAHCCAGALGGAVAGVILHGSLTLGDYIPGRSDVDLLVVIDDPLTDAQLDALTAAVATQRDEAPGRVG
jgi:hypothetical protein